MWANPLRCSLPLMCHAVDTILTHMAQLQNLTCGLFVCHSGTTMRIYLGLFPHLSLQMKILGCKIIPDLCLIQLLIAIEHVSKCRDTLKQAEERESQTMDLKRTWETSGLTSPCQGRNRSPRDPRGLAQHFTGSGQFGTRIPWLCVQFLDYITETVLIRKILVS